MNKAKILEIEAISRRFGGLVAVNEVSFSVQEKEIFGLIGPNGAGKTTIINFSMEKARDAAWLFAKTLSPLSTEQHQQEIAGKDTGIALFSNVISHPGFAGSLVNKIIRLGERGTIRQRIEILE